MTGVYNEVYTHRGGVTMPHHPNLSIELTPDDLKRVRELAKRLNLLVIGGSHSREGSPRQLLIALAKAVEAEGVKHVAAVISEVIQDQ